MSEVLELPVGKVHPDPDNPRSTMGDLSELAASIGQVGVLEPVLVRSHPTRKGDWMLVAGHRRLAASKAAKLKVIPALATDVDEKQAAVWQLIENLQREDLDPIDEARALRRLVDLGFTQKALAEKIARSPGHISKRLTLIDLPDKATALVSAGKLRVEDAYDLARTIKLGEVDSARLLSRVVTDASNGHGLRERSQVSRQIKQAQTEAQEQRARVKVHEQLIAAGDRELTSSGGAKKVEGWESLDLDVGRHRKEPCSRFKLVSTYGRNYNERSWAAEWWCSDPKRHSPTGGSGLKTKKEKKRPAGESSYSREQRLRESRRVERIGLVAHALIEPPLSESIYRQVVLLLVETMNSTGLRTAVDLLATTPFEKLRPKVNASASHALLKAAVLGMFVVDPLRVALAVAVACGEERLYGWENEPTDYRSQFVTLLTSGGQGSLVEVSP